MQAYCLNAHQHTITFRLRYCIYDAAKVSIIIRTSSGNSDTGKCPWQPLARAAFCCMGLPLHPHRQAQPNAAAGYARHRPETTLLYQIIHEYWPDFPEGVVELDLE